MDDKQFEFLTAARDRRGENPEELRLKIVDDAEQAAFDFHKMWCDEANEFTPIEYAKQRLCSDVHIKPEPLREIIGGWPLSLLGEEKLTLVARLAEKDLEVWNYIKHWLVDGVDGDPRPEVVPAALTGLIRLALKGELLTGGGRELSVGFPDEAIRHVADELHNRYGYAPYNEACLDVLSEVTGLSQATVRDKIKDAGKGTGKKSYRRKSRRRKSAG